MRNADNNHDPRGWHDRSSPVGRRRRHRPGGSDPADQSRRPAPLACRSAAPPFLSVPDADTRSFCRGFSFEPAASDPSPATVPGPAEMVSILLAAAQEHFADSRYAAAEAFLKLIRQAEPQPAARWVRLGNLHFSLAEYEAAGRAYGYAAAYDPRDPGLQVRLAQTCLRLEDIPNFEGYLRRALALDPESPPALQLLGDLNRDEGRYTEAAGYYDRLIQAAPDHYENLLSLALCHACLGEHEAALGWLQRAGQTARGPLSPAEG